MFLNLCHIMCLHLFTFLHLFFMSLLRFISLPFYLLIASPAHLFSYFTCPLSLYDAMQAIPCFSPYNTMINSATAFLLLLLSSSYIRSPL